MMNILRATIGQKSLRMNAAGRNISAAPVLCQQQHNGNPQKSHRHKHPEMEWKDFGDETVEEIVVRESIRVGLDDPFIF
jgi:hypothetical protein